VLPGVGAFESGMAGLRERSLVAAIRVHALAGKPLLGICLGMQMLATVSEEFGEHEGLDLIPGRVVPIPATTLEGVPQKTPHVGWSALHKAPGAEWVKTPLEDIHAGASVYLVHSFAVRTIDPIHTIAFCQIGGHPVCAAIRSGAMIGCQFHPEKSGSVGLAILKKFIES
jgi:glutamine amidotransferase